MPDLVLPGIDTPAPTSEGTEGAAPAAPAPLPGDTSTQSASVDTQGPAPTEPAGEPTPPEPEQQRQRGVQRRIGELVERERVAMERGDRLERLLGQVVQGMMTPAQARAQAGAGVDDPRPEPNDGRFRTWEQYNSALMQWEARRVVNEQFARLGQYQQQEAERQSREYAEQQHSAAVEQLDQHLGSEMRAAAARIPGYAEAMSNSHFEVSDRMKTAIAVTGAVGEVTMYLAHYPYLVRQLERMPDMMLGSALARVASHMRNGSAAVSNAPTPGRPVGSRGSSPLDYPKNATPEQHLEWEARQRRAKEGARR